MLLAHEVIPHHHHDGEIHFDSHDCGQEECHFPMEGEDHDHSESGCCTLSGLIVLAPANQDHFLSYSFSNHEEDNAGIFFIAPFGLYPGNLFLNKDFPSLICPYKSPYYLSYKGSCQSLRAPPFA
jgi:hypothetical protein